jgi:hypothetical protein
MVIGDADQASPGGKMTQNVITSPGLPLVYRRFAGGTARPDFGGKMGTIAELVAFYRYLESAVARSRS